MPIKMRCRRLNMHLYCKLLCRVLTLYIINKSKLHKLAHTLQKYFTTSQTPPPQKKNRIITIIIKIHDHNDNSNKILISYTHPKIKRI